MEERVQKIMAEAGIGSRRVCEKYIESGRVTVNGKRAKLGMKATTGVDEIRFDGQIIKPPAKFTYIMLNKPRGVISDEDVSGKKVSARDLIPLEGHLYPVGRLDLTSEGLLLLTNDGDLTHKLTHPSYEHSKVYHVWVEGSPSEPTLDVWRRGVMLDGKKTKAAQVKKLRKTHDGAMLEVTLEEGRKRQIRRVAAKIGHPVYKLVRVSMGPLELGDLPDGAWRLLTDEEVTALKKVKRSSRPRPRKQPNKQGGPKKTRNQQGGKKRRR